MRNKTPRISVTKGPQSIFKALTSLPQVRNIATLVLFLLVCWPVIADSPKPGHLKSLYQKAKVATKHNNFSKVLTLLLTPAKKGDYVSMFLVGDAYRELYLAQPDIKSFLIQAIYWLKKTAKVNASRAGYLLAAISYQTQYGKGDYRQARYWLHRSAKAGYAPALNTLGLFYQNGQGVKVNLKKAEHFYKASLAGGYKGAITNLSILHLQSPQSQYHYQQGTYYYKKSIKLNSEEKINDVRSTKHDFALLHYRYKQYRLACDTWKPLADIGHQGSQYNLARCYEYGIGYKKDLQKGLYYYQLAYKNGRHSLKKYIETLKDKIEVMETAKLATNYFQQTVKVGAQSHCGLVIAVKPPIAKIQTRIGERWLRIDQLHPLVLSRLKPCRFVRGQYVEPN